MNISTVQLQSSSSIDPVLLLEWFAASLVLVIVVTLIYVFVLNKSPPPEGLTVAKAEQQQQQSTQVIESTTDPSSALAQADAALRVNNLNLAVEYSVQAVSLCLTGLILRSSGLVAPNMGISDLAYLAQSRAKSAPQFAEPVYQLNNLRLRVAQSQLITAQEASWAVSFANWLAQVCSSDQIKF